MFDSVGTLTIGALAVDPANGNVVWVGTGERAILRRVLRHGPLPVHRRRRDLPGPQRIGRRALQLSYIQSIACIPPTPDAAGQRRGLLPAGGTMTRAASTRAPTAARPGACWPAGQRRRLRPRPPERRLRGHERRRRVQVHQRRRYLGAGQPRLHGQRPPAAGHGAEQPQTLYALSSGSRLYRTTNCAGNWTHPNSQACEGQCTYNLTLDVHPTDPERSWWARSASPARRTAGPPSPP